MFGKSFKAEIRERWNKMRQEENIPWKGIVSIIVCCVAWPVCSCANWLVWILKWTPYLFGTLIPLCVVSCSVGWIPCEISENFTHGIAQIVFWFILCKLGINILTPIINRIPFSQIQVNIQSDMVNNIQR